MTATSQPCGRCQSGLSVAGEGGVAAARSQCSASCAQRATERIADGVLIVSLDRLAAALRTAAGTMQRPAFLAGEASSR